MNFEHLSSTEKLYFKLNDTIETKKKNKQQFHNKLRLLKSTNNSLFLKFVQRQDEKKKIEKLKKEKLKLGIVTFEIKEVMFANYVIFDTIEMIFSRQDNTETNSLKVENQLAALNWKWDFDNIFALITISTILIFYFYNILYDYFELNILSDLKDFKFNQESLLIAAKTLLSTYFSFLRNVYFMNKNFNDNLLDLFGFFYL